MGKKLQKKAGKKSPKLNRSARHKVKYQLQYARTFRNKLRRIRESNGPDAALAYQRAYASGGAAPRSR